MITEKPDISTEISPDKIRELHEYYYNFVSQMEIDFERMIEFEDDGRVYDIESMEGVRRQAKVVKELLNAYLR